MQPNENKVVRAIDLGYGFTKFIKKTSSKGSVFPDSFPSVVAMSDKDSTLETGGMLKVDANTVKHNGVTYKVGKDIALVSNSYSNRILNMQYIQSNDYHVLMKGALKAMEVELIDILVLGTPVVNYEAAKPYLIETWTGNINLDDDLFVKVNKVIVVPQPLGGFMYYTEMANNFESIKKQRNLIVDIGYFTFDWMLIDGMKMMSTSGSYQGGMSLVVNTLANKIGSSSDNLTTVTKIDKFLYDDEPFIWKGEPFNLKVYMPEVNTIIEKAVQTMVTAITDLDNVDNIIVIGGGAELYMPIIQKNFKDRPIKLTKGKSFSNVLGFQQMGYVAIKK